MALTKEQLENAAKSIGLDYATVAAVAEIESSGRGFAKNGFPIILFEGHHFSRLTRGQYDATHPSISYPRWTRQFYSKSQEGEQKRLETAISLNRNAALQSASYGLFQIMGFNFAACGCSSVQEFVNKMCKSEQDQLELFLKFLKSQDLIKFLKAKAWAEFARRYNGPGFAQNKYDIKLANAHLKHTEIERNANRNQKT